LLQRDHTGTFETNEQGLEKCGTLLPQREHVLVTSIQFLVKSGRLELYILLSFEGMGYNSSTILLQLHWAISLNLAGQVQQQPSIKDKDSNVRHLPFFDAAPAVQR
jgi:hypothetical protein